MKWEHKCSLDWMEYRQRELTFSSIKPLIPETATGRPKKITDEDYLKVYGTCFGIIDDDSCVSYGAAARGHIMEPYAVDFWNHAVPSNKMFHWDDQVIWNTVHGISGSVGFSPDALNIPHELKDPSISVDELEDEPTEMLEIKSYDTSKHLVCGFTPKDRLQERWQIAMGMLVCPSIQLGHVLFFDPRCEQGCFVHSYRRFELQHEIDTLKDAAGNYYDWLHTFLGRGALSAAAVNLGQPTALKLPGEKEIYQRYIQERGLNPY